MVAGAELKEAHGPTRSLPDIGPACRPADADPGGRVTVDVPLSRSQAHHDETHQRDYEDEPELQSEDVQIEQRCQDEVGPNRNEEIVAPAPGDAFDQGGQRGPALRRSGRLRSSGLP